MNHEQCRSGCGQRARDHGKPLGLLHCNSRGTFWVRTPDDGSFPMTETDKPYVRVFDHPKILFLVPACVLSPEWISWFGLEDISGCEGFGVTKKSLGCEGFRLWRFLRMSQEDTRIGMHFF